MEQFDDDTQVSIRERAAEWFLRLHAHDLSVAERFAYLQWLKASPAHIGETLLMCKLYALLYPLKKQPIFAGADDVSHVIELPREGGAAHAATTRSSWHVRALIVALAIGVALLAGAIVKRIAFDPTIQTQASEWRSLPLKDGSLVSVGPNTRLRNQFDGQLRLLRLARGEALFEVARDAARPFVVDAELATVRATGTRFGVSRRDREVIVTVEEGSVLVSHDRDPANAVEVEGGEQTIVSAVWPPTVHRVDAVRALAWSSRRLIFDNDSVAVAAAEFNRRNRVQLVVDPTLSRQRVFGEFYADDPGSFAESLANTGKGIVVHRSPDVILLQPPAQPR